MKGIRTASALGFIGVVCLLWGAEILVGKVPYWGVIYLQFQPWWSEVGAAYRGGSLPLWSQWAGFGAPLAANPQAAAFSPFALLAVLLPAEHALGVSILLHSLLAGFGAFLAARRLGSSSASSAVAGIVFPLSAALAGRSIFPSFYSTAAWLGFAVACWPRECRSLRGVVPPALVLAFAWLDGHPQAWLMVAMGSILSGIRTVASASSHSLGQGSDQERTDSRHSTTGGGPIALGRRQIRGGGALRQRRLSAILWVGLALALAIGLTAFQWLPALELFSRSVRAGGLSPAEMLPFDAPLKAALLGVIPDLFGSPTYGNWTGDVGYWEWAWYVGTTALALAAMGARSQSARFPVILLVIGLVVAFLPAVAGSIGRTLVGGELLRGSGRALVLADFALALLAAAGLDRLSTAPVLARRRAGRLTLAVGAGLTLGGVAGLALGGDPFIRSGLGFLIAGSVMLVGQRFGRTAVRATFAVLTAVELLVFSRPLLPLSDPLVYQGSPLPGTTLLTTRAVFIDHFFSAFPLTTFASGDMSRFGAEMLPNRGALFGYRDALAYDPLRLSSVDRAIELMPGDFGAGRLGITARAVGLGLPTPLSARERVAIVPRAEVVPDTDSALRRLFDPKFRVDDTVILGDRPPVPPPEGSESGPVSSATIVEDFAGRLVVATTSPEAGYLRILDSDYPGWSATADGRSIPVLKADGIFRAVALSPGTHVVVFEYRPTSLMIGFALSLATACLVGFLLVWRRELLPNGQL